MKRFLSLFMILISLFMIGCEPESDETGANVEKNITELKIKSSGKTEYLTDEVFDVTGFVIRAMYEGGYIDVDLTNEMIGEYDFTTAGMKTITITYENIQKDIFVNVTEKKAVPVSLELKTKGQDKYCNIVSLDLSGYVFEVVYSDESREKVTITSDMVDKTTFEENLSDDPVEEKINVTYKIDGVTLKTSFTVDVLAEWDYEEYIGEIEDRIYIDKVYARLMEVIPAETETSFELPTSSDYDYRVKIIYSTSNSLSLSPDGVVERVKDDVVVTLTVEIKGNYLSEKYTWEIKIKGLGEVILPPFDRTKKKVFAYFYEGTYKEIPEEDALRIDVLNYCFGRVGTGYTVDTSGLAHVKEIMNLRRQYKFRVVLSIGGGASGGFSDACLDENRATFVASILDTMKKYDFDGVDIDWEYPSWTGLADSKAVDKANFTKLLKELRVAFDEYRDDMLVTAALMGGIGVSRFYEVAEINKYLDYAHIMTYDLNIDSTASHHCNVYEGRSYSALGALKLFASEGMSYSKMVIGVAFYGKISELSTPMAATAQVLNKPVVSGSTKSITYTLISKTYLSDPTYVKLYDSVCGAYYLTNGKYFITYENQQSIELKGNVVQDLDLAGMMFWDYGSDATGTLLNAVFAEMNSINTGRK